MCWQVLVEVMQLQSDDIDCELANPGENVKVKLKNANEDVSIRERLLPREQLNITLLIRST